MNVESEFKIWFDSTQFKKLNLSKAERGMMLLAFERGADRRLDYDRKNYKMTLKDGE